VAALLSRPWVADFRDPWARAPWREDRFAFEKGAWQVLERRVVTRADATVFVTHTNCEEFAKHYGTAIASRFHVAPNGCDVNEFDGLVRRPPVADAPFVLVHAGSLYGARDPRPLLRALHAAIQSGAIQADRFRLRFIGRVGVPGLRDAVRECGLERVVEFVSHMPRQAALQEMVNASALLIVQPVTTVSVPAKLYEYMAARRPVLALAEPGGETAQVVTRSGAGIVVPSHDDHAIMEALIAMTTQSQPLTQVSPSEYDGEHRAVQLGRLLFDVVAAASADGARREPPHRTAQQARDNAKPSEVTRV
jgi:glycosyltransferase involved in cell wall biosynthesis